MSLDFKFPKFLKEAFWNNKKYTCIKAGRRTGKTYNAVIWLIVSLLSEPNKSGLWVDTTQTNLDNYIERYFRPLLGKLWEVCRYDKQKHILTLPNGSYLDMRSAERPELMEGFEYDYIVINEAGIVLKKPALWQNTIQPMAKNAVCKIIGTPKGKNLFSQLYHQNDSDWASYSFSAYDSPYWEAADLDKIKMTVPQIVWDQEYLAQFNEGTGQVFRNIEACTIPVDDDYKPCSSTEYIMGVDLAKYADFTVACIMEAETGKLVYMDRWNQLNWQLQIDRIANLSDKFNQPRILVDSTGVGDVILEELLSKNLSVEGFVFTNSSKESLIRRLVTSFEKEIIQIMGFEELLNELAVYEAEKTSSGNFRYNAPSGLHDDCVIALALVNQLFTQQAVQIFTL